MNYRTQTKIQQISAFQQICSEYFNTQKTIENSKQLFTVQPL